MTNRTDEDRLDFLQVLLDQGAYTGTAILRISKTGRGFRLHESSKSQAVPDIRKAIDDFIDEGGYMMIPKEGGGAK